MAAAALIITLITVNLIVIGSADTYISRADDIDSLSHAECVLVPGAKVYSDTALSPVLKDRVDGAIAIYQAGKADRLLFSGDHGQTEYDEVNAMMAYAISQGVPQEDIFLDHAGFSTYETMVRARDVFCVKSVIIVTQKFHLSRAVYLARRLGLDACGVNSDPRRYINATRDALREGLARVKDFFYINVLKPEPTYLGEPIPITGDSSLTHDKG
jgi:vancomycin permeability regulator SanA